MERGKYPIKANEILPSFQFEFRTPNGKGGVTIHTINHEYNQYFVQSRGRGWRDKQPTQWSKEQMIEFIWENRRHVNIELDKY